MYREEGYLNPRNFEIVNFSYIYEGSYLSYEIKDIKSHLIKVETIKNIPHFIFEFPKFRASFIHINDSNITSLDEIKNIYTDLIAHREDEEASIENIDGVKKWYKRGIRHRDNELPSVEGSNCKTFYFNNFQHRKDALPANTSYRHRNFFIFGNSVDPKDSLNYEIIKHKTFLINNIKHEEFEDNLGNQFTLCNGFFHREDDKPAFFNKLYSIWFKKGIPDRSFKPSFIFNGDQKKEEYFFKNGRVLTKEEEKQVIMAGKIASF